MPIVAEHIFHMALPADWDAARRDDSYRISTRGMPLDEVGFIHCSRRRQLEGVANGFYGDVDEVVVLTIDPDRVDSDVVWEQPAPGIDDTFPHIYGPLPVVAVVESTRWRRGNGGWTLDDLR